MQTIDIASLSPSPPKAEYAPRTFCDIIRLGPQHERGGFLELHQGKTGADVSIPIHLALRAILKASKGGHLAYLTTATGAPFSPAAISPIGLARPSAPPAYLWVCPRMDCERRCADA
jgi:hypothetical protein